MLLPWTCRLRGFASSESMDASRKKARTGTGNVPAEDRLSALPDALIHTIMSFLKAHQVVQTCVLAKRWMHLWRSVPKLDIDLPEFNSKMTGLRVAARYEKLVDFADYLMFHRHQDGALLDTFRLHVDSTHQATHADATRWVRRALKCLPRVLDIRAYSLTGYNHHRAQMTLELPCGSCRLTKLYLLHVSLNHSFAEQISSVCDVLEELELKSCSISFMKFTSPSLKNLIIDCCRIFCYRLSITAPHLVSLHLNLEATYVKVVSVNEMVSLVKASIHNWIDYRGKHRESGFGVQMGT
ncbi:MEIOTIC F-BOX protein MOF isoform X1 [Lolium perenne]|uniref:MEIOTIC F-BOX protein MOF isoform X1 n=1 Tax=Lolium perenne TaxID=4522 RepID=UPI003A9A4448